MMRGFRFSLCKSAVRITSLVLALMMFAGVLFVEADENAYALSVLGKNKSTEAPQIQGQPALKGTKYKPDEVMPPLQKTIRKSEIRVQQAEEVLKEIDELRWKPLPDDFEALSLKTLLVNTEDHHPKARLEENAVMRSAITQQAILDSITAYSGLIQQWLLQAALYQELRVRKKEVLLSAERFELGDVTSIEVLKSEAKLLESYQRFKEAQKKYAETSQAMALNAGLDTRPLYFPKLLTFDGTHYQVDFPPILPEKLQAKQAMAAASYYSPEVRQLEAVRDEFRMKYLGLSTITPPGAAHLKGLETLIQQARKASEGVAYRDYQNLTTAGDLEKRAYAMVQLSEKAYYQIQVSYEAGFSSDKDIEEIALGRMSAEAAFIAAIADAYTTRTKLLRDMGQLSAHTALHGLDLKDLEKKRPRRLFDFEKSTEPQEPETQKLPETEVPELPEMQTVPEDEPSETVTP